MKKILITGALGQIGSELTLHLRNIYGDENVVASDLKPSVPAGALENGPYEVVDVTQAIKWPRP